MEDKTRPPESKARRNSQRDFLLTVIGLLATLIFSALCVIGLLILKPAESQAAQDKNTPEPTPELNGTQAGERFSDGQTADNSPAEAAGEDELQRGSRRIIDYSQPPAGRNGFNAYPQGQNGDHRVVPYDLINLASDSTTEADPRPSHRIIEYKDGN